MDLIIRELHEQIVGCINESTAPLEAVKYVLADIYRAVSDLADEQVARQIKARKEAQDAKDIHTAELAELSEPGNTAE